MKIRPAHNVTPQSSPPGSTADDGSAVDERFVWEMLAPRLIHPSKLRIIQVLLREGQALTPGDLARETEDKEDLVRYQCKSMQRAGVLEIADTPGPTGDGEEASYFFPKPTAEASRPPSPVPPPHD
jgi:hypothetical protein